MESTFEKLLVGEHGEVKEFEHSPVICIKKLAYSIR